MKVLILAVPGILYLAPIPSYYRPCVLVARLHQAGNFAHTCRRCEILVRSTNRQRADAEHYGTRSKDGDKDKTTGRDIFPATIQDTRLGFGPIELE